MIRINFDKTKETYGHILIPQERSVSLLLRHEEWLVGIPISIENFESVTPVPL